MKKLITIFLTLLLFVSICPIQNINAGTTYNATDIYDGEGTKGNPFILTNVEDINKLSFLNNEVENTYYFKLADNFNDTTVITSLINCVQLKGLDGNNKTIHIDLEASHTQRGLFNAVDNSTFKNITIKGEITQTEEDFEDSISVFGAHIFSCEFTNVVLDVKFDNLGYYSVGFGGTVKDSTFTNCTIKNEIKAGNVSFYFGMITQNNTYTNCDVSQATLVSPVFDNFYTKDSNNTMAYLIMDSFFDVSFNLDYYRMVSYFFRAFETYYETETDDADLGINLAADFIPGKSTIQFTLTYTNNMDIELTYTPRIDCDTAIDGNDASSNKVENKVLMMSANGVTLFVKSTDTDFTALPIECDDLIENLEDMEIAANAEDSAIVMYWNEATLQPAESKTYTFYIGMTYTADAANIAAQMGKPQLVTADETEFSVKSNGDGYGKYLVGNTKDTTAHIYGLELSNVIPNAVSNPSNPFEHIKVTNGNKQLTYGTDYTVVPGSIKVQLNKSYLDTLSLGKHTIKVSVDTTAATYSFNINVDIVTSLVGTDVDNTTYKLIALGSLSIAALAILLKKKEN